MKQLTKREQDSDTDILQFQLIQTCFLCFSILKVNFEIIFQFSESNDMQQRPKCIAKQSNFSQNQSNSFNDGPSQLT
jgi:hypothetical protein